MGAADKTMPRRSLHGIVAGFVTMPEAKNKTTPSVEAPVQTNAADAADDAPRLLRQALLKTFFTGLSWTAAARGLTAVGTAARYIVFVRLLKPFDFGVIASATLICTALSAATDPRMGQALIQQEDRIDPYLDTLFTTYLLRSLLIGLVLIVGARPLGAFFHLGDAYTVFWAIVPLPILQSIESRRLISLYRRLDFHFVTILNVSESRRARVRGCMAESTCTGGWCISRRGYSTCGMKKRETIIKRRSSAVWKFSLNQGDAFMNLRNTAVLLCVLALAMAGCAQQQPSAFETAVPKLRDQCVGGDTQACQKIAQGSCVAGTPETCRADCWPAEVAKACGPYLPEDARPAQPGGLPGPGGMSTY
jgi:hypothetical protein